MIVTQPVRVTRSYTQHLVAPPCAVFPLLCPVREVDWIQGWDPPLVISSSGIAEQDCVFITVDPPHDIVWYIIKHDPEDHLVEMIKITPWVTACRITIKLRPTESGCEADITYTHTSLGQKGDQFVEAFTESYYRGFMQTWESRINHFLLHGACLQTKTN